jgi:hypothetical protein
MEEAVMGNKDEQADGAALITEERRRQIKEEGWTPQHDDQHDGSELAKAAVCYAIAGLYPDGSQGAKRALEHTVVPWWPHGWAWSRWKPAGRIRNLVKAGALIAAEIDRLQREAAKHGG